MNKDKSFLRHEMLNIITLVNFLVIDTKIERKKKGEILEHLKMMALMIAEEGVFLGEKKAFFNQPLDLNETLQLVKELILAEVQKKAVQLEIPSTHLVVHADSMVLKNGLEQILRMLILLPARKIHFEIDETSKLIQIRYQSSETLDFDETKLLVFLKEKHSYAEIFFKTAIEIMKMNDIKLHFEKGLIKIKFKK